MKRFLFLLLISGCLVIPSIVANDKAVDDDEKFAVPKTDVPGAGPTRFDRGWFQNLWKRKRSGWAKQVEQDQGAVVFFGDSITQSWGEKFHGQFDGMKVANRGISGDTTRGMRYRLAEDVLSLNPRAVVLLLGTNDIEDSGDVTDATTNLKVILDDLKTHNPKMPIVLNLIFPSSEKKKRPFREIDAFNKEFAALVKGDAQVVVLDTWSLFASPDKEAMKKYFPDLLHPNKAGYEKWAAALKPVLDTLDLWEAKPDDFTPEEGFTSLFNGKDLSGWRFIATPARKNRPEVKAQKFEGQASTPDGRYVADDGRLVVTIPPEGRRFQQLWTTREFEGDFELRLEFRASPNADSGIFIRKPQLQCRDYLVAGPYKNLKKYKHLDWNEIVVKAQGGTARCTCNGEVLEEAFEVPARGPIGLEGDRGQMEYRRIRIRMLEP